jgi:glycosyltransferase involved in cell wall biosynthesis
MLVSLIATVLNEGENVRRLMNSICAQTRLPDEVVICDGGSTDNTRQILESYASQLPLRVVVAEKSNIAKGRNTAIANARYEYIAVTDAGVHLEADWLEQLIAPWQTNPELPLIAGFFRSDPQTVFEIAMGATVLPVESDINPEKFLPSSRSVAFRRSVWQAVGGYPEWLGYGEDVVFDMAVKGKFGKFGFAPKAVAHFRPRSSFSAFFRQYFNYASGDGHANLFWFRQVLRYITYGIALPLGIYFTYQYGDWVGIPFVLVASLYLIVPLRRLLPTIAQLNWKEKLYAFWLVPWIRLVGDIAKILGYPYGVWLRFTKGKV